MAVVTISRMPGALGDEVAEMLAHRIGYRLVDSRELVRLTSSAGYGTGPQLSWEHSLEVAERSPSFRERLTIDRSSYARALRHIALDLAVEDRVVIVGLGAGQVVPGLRQIVRALLVAPDEIRVRRLMAKSASAARPDGLTREEACKLLGQRDHDTASYMRYAFHIDWLEPRHWDLVVNTGRFSAAKAVAILAGPVEHGLLAPRREDTWLLADLLLARRVERALMSRHEVRVHGLYVRADEGQLRISGVVPTETERTTVAAIARSITGVRGVDNDVRVEMPFVTI